MSPIRLEVENRSYSCQEGQMRGFRLGENLAILIEGRNQGGKIIIAKKVSGEGQKVGNMVVLLNEEIISGEKCFRIKTLHKNRVDLTQLDIEAT